LELAFAVLTQNGKSVSLRTYVASLYRMHMPRRLFNWSYRDVIQFLKEHGFEYYEPYCGSHERWAKLKGDGTLERKVEVSRPKDAYLPKTLKTMVHQSGIPEDEWTKWANS